MVEFYHDFDFNKNQLIQPVIHKSAATPSAGVEGQVYYDTDDKLIFFFDGTEWQAIGAGSGGGVLSGAGAPDNGDGENGQFYINTSNYDIYGPKTLGVWGSPTSLIGPQGPEGDPGVDGDDGAPGDDGNTILNGTGAPGGGLGVNGDFYIRLDTWDIYGPKTAGAWGSPQSLIGPTGGDLPPGGTAGQIIIKEGPADFDADWYDPPNSGSIAWVWDNSATPNYVEDPGDNWIGPEEPQNDGATPNQGDLWFDTSEFDNYISVAASDVTFSDAGLIVITGVTTVQTALNAVDAAIDSLPLVNTTSLSPTSDTYINQQLATTNYDTATTLWIGENFTGSASFGRVALFAFDISAIDGAVLSARLRITRDEGSPSTALSTSNRLMTRRVKRAFVASEVTWNVYSTGNNWGTAGARNTSDVETPVYTAAHVLGDRDQDVWTLDLTEMVKDALDASDTTLRFLLGWALATTSQNSVQIASQDNATASKRPVLTIATWSA